MGEKLLSDELIDFWKTVADPVTMNNDQIKLFNAKFI